MDEIAKALVATSPVAAVFLLLGTQALAIWKADLQDAKSKRSDILATLTDIKRRVKRLEVDVFGDESPTEHKRPEVES